MKIKVKGNVYKRCCWFEEHKDEVYIVGVTILFVFLIVVSVITY